MREAFNERGILVDQKRQTKIKIDKQSTFCDRIQLILLQTQLMRLTFLRVDQQRFVVLLDQTWGNIMRLESLFSPIFTKNNKLVLPFTFFRRKIFGIM
jgi:hypothetical protein